MTQTLELNKVNGDLQILSSKEMQEINAGESLWYWGAYGVGSVGRFFGAVWNYCEEHPLELFIA